MKVVYPAGEKGRIKIVKRLNTGSILDVACGTGTLLILAAQKGLRCYGIDISRGMLEIAKTKVPHAEFVQASYYDIPYADGTFDYIAATNAISGVGIDEETVLSEMIRVCKSGGEVYIAEWPKAPKDTMIERFIIKMGHLNDDDPKDYLQAFRSLGYEPDVEVMSKRYHIFNIQKV